MTIHKVLYTRDDVERLYVSRKAGRRGLTSTEDNVDTSIQRLKDYIEKTKEYWYMRQNQHWQHDDQHNYNNSKRKMWRKTTLLAL